MTDVKSPNQTLRAILLMVCAAVFISTGAILIRAFGKGLPEIEYAFFRGMIGFSFLLILMLTRIKRIPIGNNKKLLFLRGLFGSVGAILYVWSIYHLEVGLANGLNQTSPIFVAIFAAILLKERFGWWIYAIIGVAFVGMTLIVSPDFSTIHFAALMAVFSAVLSGLAYTCIKKLQSTEQSDTIVLWFMGMCTLVPLFSIPFVPWQMPATTNLLGLTGAGFASLLGQIFMTQAYKSAPATIVAPFIYISTLMTLLICYLLWGELPSMSSLVGCGIIITCAIGLGVLPKNRSTQKA